MYYIPPGFDFIRVGADGSKEYVQMYNFTIIRVVRCSDYIAPPMKQQPQLQSQLQQHNSTVRRRRSVRLGKPRRSARLEKIRRSSRGG